MDNNILSNPPGKKKETDREELKINRLNATYLPQKPFLIIDGDLVTHISTEYLSLFEFTHNTPPPFVFQDIKNRIHPADLESFEKSITYAIINKENEITLHFRERILDGTYLFIKGHMKLFFKNNNQEVRIFLIYTEYRSETQKQINEKTIPLVLIVEDNKVNMYLTKELISAIIPGCQVIEACDGNQGVELYKQRMPDLVLMDINLPYKNGYQAAIQIRQFEQTTGVHCPIIAITAKHYEGEKERCLSAGMDEYLPKPVDKDQLERKILQLMNKYQILHDETLQNHYVVGTDSKHISTGSTGQNNYNNTLYSLTRLEKMSYGNSSFMKQFLTIYIEDTKESCSSLILATQTGDFAKIKSISHKLKGAIDLLEITSLQDDIRYMESQAEEKKDLTKLRIISGKIKATIDAIIISVGKDIEKMEVDQIPPEK